jgi:tRNA dimethylallyltransferase
MYAKDNLAIITGGSGLYLDAVLYGMDDIPDPDPVLREKLTKRMEIEGVQKMADELRTIDPEYYKEVDINNPKRVLRGIEVWHSTRQKFSSFRIRKDGSRSFTPLFVNLDMDREELYDRINRRVDIMISAGLEDEARQLYAHRDLNALNTVGYKEWFGHFDGDYTAEEAIRLIKRNSRHYAKRQITWNKKYQGALKIHPGSLDEIIKWVEYQTASSG